MSVNIYENKSYCVYNDEYGDDYGAISSLGIYFITDKQSVFESRMWTVENNYNRNGPTHPEMIDFIDKKIYDNDDRDHDASRRKYNAYIYLYKDNISGGCAFLIALPENRILSLSQAVFIDMALDELEECIKYMGLSLNDINISIFDGDKEQSKISVSEAKNIIRGHVIQHQEQHNEKIIGKIINDEDIRKYMDNCNYNEIGSGIKGK